MKTLQELKGVSVARKAKMIVSEIMKNSSAVELGKLSAKSRFKGMSKKERSEAMRKVRMSKSLTNAQ